MNYQLIITGRDLPRSARSQLFHLLLTFQNVITLIVVVLVSLGLSIFNLFPVSVRLQEGVNANSSNHHLYRELLYILISATFIWNVLVGLLAFVSQL